VRLSPVTVLRALSDRGIAVDDEAEAGNPGGGSARAAVRRWVDCPCILSEGCLGLDIVCSRGGRLGLELVRLPVCGVAA